MVSILMGIKGNPKVLIEYVSMMDKDVEHALKHLLVLWGSVDEMNELTLKGIMRRIFKAKSLFSGTVNTIDRALVNWLKWGKNGINKIRDKKPRVGGLPL